MSIRLKISDRWNSFWYFQTLGFWLDPVPGKRRRAILAELRENLSEAVAVNGMTSALTELGQPRELARQYVELEPKGRPNWGLGALAVTVVFGLWLFGTLVYILGMLGTLESTGQHQAESSFLGVRLITVFTSSSMGVEFAGFAWPVIIFAVTAFVLFAAPWRVMTGKSRRRAA
ncbi:HAAS signaling domain-containing protein [Paeniglutamicibacter cryotolerans]|uniref:Uncharacterized protein n=1 Tax=Paeniglutamicibacter cryotolerans TaxID=670079 RepID=A0A839QPA7_9MICC|nr:hypothetical protein [Paeniglutamicibacter cryotolerans]MBB2996475.1 hypothetical protein [Paeniglutamicibacter cryotolerans]